MVSKADCLQKGELVKFQFCTIAQTGQKMACHVVPQRRALVECVKDQVGTSPDRYKRTKTPFDHAWKLKIAFVLFFSPSLVSLHTKWVRARGCSSTSRRCRTAWSFKPGTRWSSQSSSINAQENVVPAMCAESGAEALEFQSVVCGPGLDRL